ncbi:hypothetical protein [Isoptericola aurantiacus]|uniref:hypothetical protein n=1 Tax=Isoptericola aurantiacus TaxID=3377839 RepID=UPI00383AA0BD
MELLLPLIGVPLALAAAWYSFRAAWAGLRFSHLESFHVLNSTIGGSVVLGSATLAGFGFLFSLIMALELLSGSDLLPTGVAFVTSASEVVLGGGAFYVSRYMSASRNGLVLADLDIVKLVGGRVVISGVAVGVTNLTLLLQ